MGIQNLTEDVVFINLPREPHLGNELETINDIASEGYDCDVIIDFSGVKVLASASISNLMLLHEFLRAHNRQLVLCNVPVPIQCLFIRFGLETLFEFAHDQSAALEAIREQRYKKPDEI